MFAFEEPQPEAAANVRTYLTNHFGLERMGKQKRNAPKLISNELQYIVESVIQLSSNPRTTLAELGIIFFPGILAFKKAPLAKLFSVCKTALDVKFKREDWSPEIYTPTKVRNELLKLVGSEARKWSFRSIPCDSSFASFLSIHDDLISAKGKIKTQEEVFVDDFVYSEPPTEIM